ncbi:spore germination protein [Desulfotomaculum sp. 1211_IL3151]|uniref:spore germination protein n=1 Tax=Desulfotomaculum sp. 1211_IL3151 TaxID=3084055 RepID=UPI002FD94F0A
MLKRYLKNFVVEKIMESGNQPQRPKAPVAPDLNRVMDALRQRFGSTGDLVLRKILAGNGTIPVLVVYLENMADPKTINESIIAKLQEAPVALLANSKILAHAVLPVSKVVLTGDLVKAVDGILYGKTAIFLSGSDRAIVAETSGWEKRSIQPPETETNIQGPQEGFVEAISVNITQIRRRIRDSQLRFDNLHLGTRTNTALSVAYIEGLADPGIVAEVKKRVQAIRIDGIQSAQSVMEFIKDQRLTPFSTLLKTERPAKVVACLLEGRVAIFVDGTPFVIVAPVTFAMMLQEGDDYYFSFYFGSFLRWLTLFAFTATLVLPSLYTAITTHHWEMMPTPLALSIAGSREGVPFPLLVEVLAMELTFELLREAGVRLPKAVGPAVSIAGALVIGQAAVQAGLISPVVVVLVAFTGIASFAIPSYDATLAFRLLRFPLIILSFAIGILGLVAGLIVIWAHMASLTSFGVPYLAPFTPVQVKDLKDTLFRVPTWAMVTRPQTIPSLDPDRLGKVQSHQEEDER